MNDLAKTEPQAITPAADPESSTAIIIAIERIATNTDLPIERMEKLLAMQERILDRQAEQRFGEAMAAAEAEISAHPVVRNKYNSQTKSWYADLQAKNDVAMPIITKHGLHLSFEPKENPNADEISLSYRLAGFGYSRTGAISYPLDDSGIAGTKNKTRIHATKSAYTYAQNTLVSMLFNIATRDDDGNGAGASERVSEEQALNIRALAEEVGANIPSMLKWQKAESIEGIPASKYHEVVKMLEKKRLQTKGNQA